MPAVEIDAPAKLRRSANQDASDRVAVRRALVEVIKSITFLQRETALLSALLQRSSLPSERHAERIGAVELHLREASTKLADILRPLPERQRCHGRVKDVQRALDALALMISQLPRANGSLRVF